MSPTDPAPPPERAGAVVRHLGRDPWIRLAIGLILGATLTYVLLPERLADDDTWIKSWYLAFQGAALGALFARRRASGAPATAFWNAQIFGIACWALASAGYLVVSEPVIRDSLAVQTLLDVLFLFFYFGFVLAGELRPEAGPVREEEARDRRFEIGGLAVFGVSLLAFFVLLPNVFGDPHLTQEGMTLESYLLFLVLDVYILCRFFYLGASRAARDWGPVYVSLGSAFVLWTLTDVFDLISALPGSTITFPKESTVLWFSGFVLVVVAARLPGARDDGPATVAVEEEEPMRRPHRMVLYILLLFLFFAGFGILGIDEHLTRPRGLLVLVAAGILGGLVRRQLAVLDERARHLFEQKEEALESLRSLAGTLEARVAERTTEIRETRTIALVTLARLTESRDTDTGEHLERIAQFSRILAEEARQGPYGPEITRSFVEELTRSSPLHDIGKVGIPDSILLKPAGLDDRERRVMQTHPTIGGDTLRSVMSSHGGETFLKMAMDIAYFHHERWDGSGYPEGRSKLEIPLAARIVALVDAYDAITSDRPYQDALPHEEAVRRIEADRGGHFDPHLVDAFLACHPRFLELRRRLERA